MPAVNTYRTLNDYRVSTESVYENGSRSKLGAGALVAAVFLGIGAYFFYPMYQRSAQTTPAFDETNYQAPVATDSAAPVAMDSTATPDAPSAAATTPAAPIETNATRAPAQATEMDRAPAESKPARPTQRAKQLTKAPTTSREAVPAASGDTTATPDMIAPAPIVSPPPATTEQTTDPVQDPMPITSEAPTETAPSAPAP